MYSHKSITKGISKPIKKESIIRYNERFRKGLTVMEGSYLGIENGDLAMTPHVVDFLYLHGDVNRHHRVRTLANNIIHWELTDKADAFDAYGEHSQGITDIDGLVIYWRIIHLSEDYSEYIDNPNLTKVHSVLSLLALEDF